MLGILVDSKKISFQTSLLTAGPEVFRKLSSGADPEAPEEFVN